MPPLSHRTQNTLGSVLVMCQFGLIGWLITLGAGSLRRGTVPWLSAVLLAASVALAVWTLKHNRLGNFNIRPAPKTDGVLITHGPYGYIRHPMYTAVLLGCGALALMNNTPTGWLAWSALALVLLVKSVLEERWMQHQHPAYNAYRSCSKRFIPWVF